MIAPTLELVNALVITFVATEHLLKEQLRYERGGGGTQSLRARRIYLGGLGVWILVNFGFFVSKLFAGSGGDGGDGGSHAFHFKPFPSQVALVAVLLAFVGLAWWDIHRLKPDVTVKTFARQICISTLESLLILPLVSVGVAMAFLVLIGILDVVHTSTAWLNNPIYYGVLYGPFSTIYFFTKKRCVSNRGQILPL